MTIKKGQEYIFIFHRTGCLAVSNLRSCLHAPHVRREAPLPGKALVRNIYKARHFRNHMLVEWNNLKE